MNDEKAELMHRACDGAVNSLNRTLEKIRSEFEWTSVEFSRMHNSGRIESMIEMCGGSGIKWQY